MSVLVDLAREIMRAWTRGTGSPGYAPKFGWASVFSVAGRMMMGTGAILGTAIILLEKGKAKVRKEQKISAVEKRVRENPKETKAAWELARVKLESYLDRNLSQVRSMRSSSPSYTACLLRAVIGPRKNGKRTMPSKAPAN
jgi:hypothetical protein